MSQNFQQGELKLELMKRPTVNSASAIIGTLEQGPRGPILRDVNGVRWRLSCADGVSVDCLAGSVSVRGRLAGSDLIEVEYLAPHDDEP